MRKISTLVVTTLFLLFSVHIKAQISKVKEFESKSFYKTIFAPDAFEKIGEADKQQTKADGYMDVARGYNREISDLDAIAENTRNDKDRISALKKASKLKKKRLKYLIF